MIDLLSIYGLAVVASTILAAGLGLMGVHLAARDRAMQTMCIGQGAMLGVLLGIGLTQTVLSEQLDAVAPFILAILAAAGTFWLSESLVARKSASRNTHFIALFAVLLAGGYLVSALFPALESHMAQKYFGDLATVSQNQAWMTLLVGTVLLFCMVGLQKAVSRQSFEAAILGRERNPLAGGSGVWFALGTLVIIGFAVQIVGYLFTIACLFIPTSLAARSRRLGLTRHLILAGSVAALATATGFVASLYFSRLPTVPTIVAFTALLGFVGSLLP